MLKDKNAIITGARSGIGLATVHLFAKNGCNCWAIIHREDEDFLQKIAEWQKEYQIWIKPIHIDLSDSESIKGGIKMILQEKLPIDVLVNAVGIVSPSRLFTMTRMDDIRKVMDINFFSVIEVTQLVCRAMMRQKKGNIINISSISAWGDDTSQMEYAASKAAIVIATKKLARELGSSGIRVNAIAPGLTNTKMLSELSEEAIELIKNGNGMQRIGEPDEIAELCVFLASDMANYLTGQTIKIDGGGNSLRLMISRLNSSK